MQQRLSRTSTKLKWLAPLALGLLSVGCGGGGGSAANPSSPLQTRNIGPIGISYSGHPQAEINGTSGKVSSVAQAGASYSTLSFNPAHNLDSTFLLFTRIYDPNGDQLFTAPLSGVQNPTMLSHAGLSGFPSMSNSGVVCFLTGNGSSDYSVDTMLSDGSQVKSVLAGVAAIPTISPNGSTIAYIDSLGNIWTMPSGGGTATKIYSGGNATQPGVVWSPSGTQIAFTVETSTGSPIVENVFTMSSTGANVVNMTPALYAAGQIYVTSWSPDGSTLACYYADPSTTTTSIVTIDMTGGAFGYNLTPTGFSDSSPSFSPDNLHMAFYRSNAGGATSGIYVSDFSGGNPELVVPDPSSSGLTGPAQTLVWSPWLESKNFVGAGGTITASPVSGFLMSQNADQFASLLTFTATTPADAKVTAAATNTTGAPMIYTLSADAITNISYANVYNGTHSSIPLTSTPSAIVTVDGVTGFVDYVVPAVAMKGQPMVARSAGTSVTYTGQFSAIYDGTGKNLAPNGAKTVDFDGRTGKLISFQ